MTREMKLYKFLGAIARISYQLVFSVPRRGEKAEIDDQGGDQVSQDGVGDQVAKYLRFNG